MGRWTMHERIVKYSTLDSGESGPATKNAEGPRAKRVKTARDGRVTERAAR